MLKHSEPVHMNSTLGSRDGFSLAPLFGPVFWGVILNLIGFGMSLVQALSYFRTSDRDKPIVRFSALGMIIMDIISTALIISVFWTDLILHYGGVDQFLGTTTAIGVECVISMCIAFLAQIYFMYQIYHVKPAGMMGNVILTTMGVLAFIGWAFGLACAAVMLVSQATPHYNIHFQVVFGGSKGTNAVVDIIATTMMCKYLKDSKADGMKSTANLLDALARLFMNRGAAVMLVQIFTFVMFFAFKNSQYWLAPHLLLTKVYVNTFFAILNSRAFLREKHLGDISLSSIVVNTNVTESSSVGHTGTGKSSHGSSTTQTLSFGANGSNPHFHAPLDKDKETAGKSDL